MRKKKILLVLLVLSLSLTSFLCACGQKDDLEKPEEVSGLYKLKGTFAESDEKLSDIFSLLELKEGYTKKSLKKLEVSDKRALILENLLERKNPSKEDFLDESVILFSLLDDLEYIDFVNSLDGKSFLKIEAKEAEKYLEENLSKKLGQLSEEEFAAYYEDYLKNRSENKDFKNFTLIKEKLDKEAALVFADFYEILDSRFVNYEEVGDESFFDYVIVYKNFDRDPDTVEYIKKAKEDNSPEYEVLYKEYLEEKLMNFSENKAKIDAEGQMSLFYDADPSENVDWVEYELKDAILN